MVQTKVTCQNINPVWQAGRLLPLNNGVHIWKIKVPDDKELLTDLAKILNPEENRKALLFHQQKDKWNFVARRSSLRILLSKYLPSQVSEIEFIPDPNKKPLVRPHEGEEIHFNVSHSGDLILIGFANSPIGVDIEIIKPEFGYEDMLGQCFSSEETRFIIDGDDDPKRFFHLWTRKEALIKATSKGIDDDLPGIPSLDGIHTTHIMMPGTQNDWNISSFFGPDLYEASIAYRPGHSDLVFFDFSFQDYSYEKYTRG